MKSELKKIIFDIYVHHNFEFYTMKCKKESEFENELLSEIEMLCEKIENSSLENEPTVELTILVNNYSENGINISYSSILTISKIAKYYYLQHEFSFENPDTDKMDTYLEAFRDEPYNKKQFLLESKIKDVLEKYEYLRLSYAETTEVCNGIPKFKDDCERQMTVGNAIFMDFWELNE